MKRKSAFVRVEISPQMHEYLKALFDTGFFGFNVDDAARRLLEEAVREKLISLKLVSLPLIQEKRKKRRKAK